MPHRPISVATLALFAAILFGPLVFVGGIARAGEPAAQAAAGPSPKAVHASAADQDTAGAGIRWPGARKIEDPVLAALAGGRFELDLRFRYEFADVEGFRDSHAFTLRPRLIYTTRPLAGWRGAVGMHSNLAPDRDRFNAAGLSGPSDRSVIADPEDTDLSRLWVELDAGLWETPLPLRVRAGRQRIILDDARFIGNVGWRQLEQTFDAVRARFEPHPALKIDYSYLWEVNRIFGPDADRDFDSDSHLVNVRYTGLPLGTLAGFAYLLDLEEAGGEGLSSRTFGARWTGRHALAEARALDWAASLAFQEDHGPNPADFRAWYGAAELKLTGRAGLSGGAGFELLGSDPGDGVFTTPLATGHKFNGFADAFLATPPGGLRDTYLFIGSPLPEPLEGTWRLTGHHFTGDRSGGDLGWEIDAVASHRVNEHLSLLTKVAHFDGEGRSDITRLWLQASLSF